MKIRAAIGIGVVAALLTGCDATTRHRVLTFFFDGVPPLKLPGEVEAKPAAAAAVPAQAGPAQYFEHGPYAAKLCNGCHEEGAGNALVLPRDQLCFRCHDLKLDRKYVHGPIASGGCLVCHDPHSSQYPHLLVSESDGFCFTCHDRESVAKNAAHADLREQCTTCHDAHMSDRKYLLK